MERLKRLFLLILLVTSIITIAACNPFAPALDDDPNAVQGLLSDQTTLEGVFKNFQYAYSFKDTLIYGELLHPDFIFTYRDYDLGYDVSWGREEEMITSHGLFQNSQRLDLIWNNVILTTEDSLDARVVRGFNLSITFNPTDVIRIDGRANFTFKKNNSSGKWQIINWLDESNL